MARVRTRKYATRNARDKQQSDQKSKGKDKTKNAAAAGVGILATLFSMQKAMGNQGTQETLTKKPEEDSSIKPPPPIMTPDFGMYMSPYSQERDTQAGYGPYRALIKEQLAEKEKQRDSSRDDADYDEDPDADFEDEEAETEAEDAEVDNADEMLGYSDLEPELAEQQAQMVQERRDTVLAELKQAAEEAEQNPNRTPTEMSKQLEAMERAKHMLTSPSKDLGRWNLDS